LPKCRAMITRQLRPFLRWAGGKSKVVHHLLRYVPVEYSGYWEPFLGAAALFFALAPPKAFLSDLNTDLIHCYLQVRDNPELICRYLREHAPRTSERYYYQIRSKYNSCRQREPSAAQAARFIYLNKTSFNGIFRVNRRGEYNVPYGHKEPPALPSAEQLVEASRSLRKVTLRAETFDAALKFNSPQPGDLVYLDPPYPPLSETSYFTHYTSSRFTWQDHRRVAEVANSLADKGAFVMISNADSKSVRGLYEGWYQHRLPVVRWIAANGRRPKAAELVITNYVVECADCSSQEGGSQ